MTSDTLIARHDPLGGGGAMGELMRSIDWSKTPVGSVATWPQSLRTALSILLETGFPMYIAWGPEFTQFYNDGYRPILGSTKHPAAMGISTRETFAEIWDIIGPMFQDVMQGKSITVQDFLLPLDRHGFAEECYFVFSYSPIRDESGAVGGVLVTVTETTERVLGARRLETLHALAADTREARTVAESCAVAARVLSANAADLPFAHIYLVDADRQTARLASSTSGDSGGLSAPAMVDLSAAAGPWPLGAVVRDLVPMMADTTGGRAGVLVLPVMQQGANQALGALVCAISPRLVVDDAYRRFLSLVAGQIATAIASAQALEEARARAEALAELDRAKTMFFSNVSHEFRTPLTLMLGPAEDALAGAESLAPADRERWSLVHRNALRLSKLVNTLLDFSRIEAGRMEASYEPTDLGAFTGELVSMFRSAIDHAGLSLRLDLPPLSEPAYIDREMWEKIVLNLLSNALKYTFSGEIALSLRLDADDFELVVRDTGIGIAPHELPHVFTRFHRIRGARARTHEGTGIGLALVAELVKLHGGHVSARSVEDGGTTFTVRIPRGKTHLPADRIGVARQLSTTSVGAAPYVEEALRWTSSAAPKRPPALTSAGQRDARRKILLADDNADMRDYVRRLLEEQWTVEAVSDGNAAIAALRREPANLVLADVMMPGLDGFELLRAIRTDGALRLTPVILLSARAGEEATAEGLRAGANDYIVKPFNARELLVRVTSTLAAAEAAREVHAVEQAARKRLYGHFMQAPFPVAVLRGPDHVLELANPLALAAWGKGEEILDQPVAHGIPELQGQPFLGYLDDVYRTGVAFEARGALARLARAPGGALEDGYFDFVYAPLRDTDGAMDGILVCGFEVTAQVRAAQELSRLLAATEASERQFRELVENLPDLAWTAGPDGFIDYYNRRWYEYTGTTPGEMEGWGWQSVHDPAHLDRVLERWRHAIATGTRFEMEFPLRRADGVFRWFLTRVEPLHDADGRLVRWFGSNTDIDERRRNEAFREMFLGILGHDLRNPLNTILTTSRVLLMRADTPHNIRSKLERVTSSGVRMQRMIEQLLDLTRARLTDGLPMSLSEEPLDVAPLVRKIVDEIRTARPEAAIDVSVSGDCAVHVDPDRFEQVVSNLVGNAVLHGDTTQPVCVTLEAEPEGVRLGVHNQGPPIPADLLPVLFSPFARGETPRSGSAGLGLGLYISERIIDAHGGTLSVRSSAEAGTHFTALLPRRPR